MSSKRNSKEDGESKFTKGFFKRNSGVITKVTLAALCMTGLTFNFGFASNINDKGTIKKIYHVYANDSYIGTVSDKETVDAVLEKQEALASNQYTELEVEVGSNIKVIPEQVFNNETNDVATLQKLEEAVAVEASAFTILVDNEPVASLKDLEAYEETIRQVQQQFVTKEEFAQWKTSQSSETPLPALKTGETRIADISFEQNISSLTESVSPTAILTPEEAVKLLMTGVIEQEKYTVQSGDVLGSIAKDHDLKTEELLVLNPDITEDTVLQIEQQLNVTVAKPFVTVKVVKEEKVAEVIKYNVVTEQDSSMFKGEKVVKQEGSDGKKDASYQITEENGVRIATSLLEETVLTEAVDRVEVVGTKVISSRGTGEFSWPAVGGYISSNMGDRWGSLHRGIDIARPSNYNILVADNGVVTAAGYESSYGNRIVINHNNGYTTLYAHLSQIDVSVGQVVPKGSVIGIMGSTGNSTGTHLHFEVEKNGSLINPVSVVSR